MVGRPHRLNGHQFDQTPGDGEGQGCLACCSPWGCKELNTAEQLDRQPYSVTSFSHSRKESTNTCYNMTEP